MHLVDRAAFKTLEPARMLAVHRNESSAPATVCGKSELAGSDEALLVRERKVDAALERPERRRQACEADDRVQHEVRLCLLEQLGEIATGLRQRGQPVDRLEARGCSAELELRTRVDDLQRLAPDRACGAEKRDPLHPGSVGSPR